MSRLPDLHRTLLFDIPVDTLSSAEVLARLRRMVRARKKAWVLSVNPLTVMLSQNDPRLKEIFASAELSVPDGVGTVWALKQLKGIKTERVAGIDLAACLFREKIRVYLLGGQPGVAKKAGVKIARKFPRVRVAGWRDGYFKPMENAKVIKEINQSKPDLLIVGMGQPKQELWVASSFRRLPRCVILPVGGALDVFSGRVGRAPLFWQRTGCEWLYRFIREPQRIPRSLQLASFVFKVLRTKLFK